MGRTVQLIVSLEGAKKVECSAFATVGALLEDQGKNVEDIEQALRDGSSELLVDGEPAGLYTPVGEARVIILSHQFSAG